MARTPSRTPSRAPSVKSWTAVLVGLFACLLIASPASAQSPYSEKEAQAIDRMLMCPVCPAETIDQAQVEISFQMRAVVREMLAEGRSRQEILDFFVERYGPDILAAPPKSGANLLAWVLPIAGVAAGLVGAYFVIRSMTARNRGRGTPGNSPVAGHDPHLGPYLEMVDRRLAAERISGATTARRPSVAPGDEESDAL